MAFLAPAVLLLVIGAVVLALALRRTPVDDLAERTRTAIDADFARAAASFRAESNRQRAVRAATDDAYVARWNAMADGVGVDPIPRGWVPPKDAPTSKWDQS